MERLEILLNGKRLALLAASLCSAGLGHHLLLSRTLPQRSEARAKLFRKELRLFKGRKVPALRDLVVMDQFGIRLLCPALRSRIELVGKHTHGYRNGDALRVEVPTFAPVLPIETGPGERRVRQPSDRDVVED